MRLSICIIITCLLFTVNIGQRFQCIDQQEVIYSQENTIDGLFALNLKLRTRIPTPCDIQQMLLNAGYDIGPRGVDCEMGTESTAAWEKASGNQFANQLSGHYYKE